MIQLVGTHSSVFVIVNADNYNSQGQMAKDPFPNDWEDINNLDDDDIEPAPFIEVFEDIMEWHLPQPYCCVVRIYNRSSNKLKEVAYKREGVAQQKIKAAAEAGLEVTVLTNHLIATVNYPDND